MGEEGEGGLGGGDVGGGFGEGEEGFEVLVGLGMGVRWGGKVGRRSRGFMCTAIHTIARFVFAPSVDSSISGHLPKSLSCSSIAVADCADSFASFSSALLRIVRLS